MAVDSYSQAGVDYDPVDTFKRLAQKAALETSKILTQHGFVEVTSSRGESVYLIDGKNSFHYLAHVEEGLGTKNIVADAMHELTDKSYYDQIAQDTIAMIVNDMITLGAQPITIAMHCAAGSSKWFNNKKRLRDLVNGWEHACQISGCSWGGGETPILKDVVYPDKVVLSGSALGVIEPKNHLVRGHVKGGDAIILLASSGIHANGVTLARKIAESLPNGYLTRLPDGRSYGEALLDPTIIYVPIIKACLNASITIHYAVNITGHGWRKLMRHPKRFRYVINTIPQPQSVFSFIQQHGKISDQEMYATFNMGAGFALFVPQKDANQTIKIAKNHKIQAIHAGIVQKSSTKQLIIKPKNILFHAKSLNIRS